MARIDAVTGALGFTGRAIAGRLLADGRRVVTITRRPHLPNPFGSGMSVVALDYQRPDRIARVLEGCECLYNTTWLRFPRGSATFEQAVERTGILMQAARLAGVRRVVQVSVVGADPASPLPYWAAKGRAERIVRESGIPWAIIRPTLLFGPDDILINDLAWFLRRFPVFALPVAPDRPVQPVHVDDVARLAIELADGPEGRTIDAAGPEVLTFGELVDVVRGAVGSNARIVALPTILAFLASRAFGVAMRDVVLTGDEIRALAAGLLASDDPPTGTIRFSSWVTENAAQLGIRYHSELGRNYRSVTPP